MKGITGRFLILASAAALALAIFVAWVFFNAGGTAVTTAFDDIGEAVAAALAAISCWAAVRRAHGRLRATWFLLGGFSFLWLLGEVVWTYYEVGRGIAVPFPSLADVGFLGAVPFGLAAVLSMPTAPRRRLQRARTLLDFATVTLSLFFVSWAVVLLPVASHSSADLFSVIVSLAYPAGDFLMASLVMVAASRARGSEVRPLLLILGGLLAIAVSDSMFAYLTAADNYNGNVLDAGWVAGFLLLALAPLVPTREESEEKAEPQTAIWQVAVPWITIGAFAVAAAALAITGHGLDPIEAGVAAGIGVLLVGSQALALTDSKRLIADTLRVADRLRVSEARFRAVYDSAPVAIARIGRERVVVEGNPGLSRVLGYSVEELEDMPLARFIPGDDAAAFDAAWKRLMAGESTVEFEGQAIKGDGSMAWLRWTATVLRDERGMYGLAVIEDITAEHAAQEAERAALRELERVNQLKTDFISIVSHEFRTALTGVQGFSEVLRDQLLTPEEVREYAGDINADARRLNRMITEMLDLDRLESGRVSVHPEPLNLAELLREAVSRAEVAGAEHVFVVRVRDSLPLVDADRDKIMQVATNLLTNAVKYSPPGSSIEVSANARNGIVETSIRDHGPGIPPESLEAIFERFTRLETSGSRVAGTGLGLAISRQIVQLHGGRIWAENSPEGGACFHFTLRRAVSANARRRVAQRAT